jgi:AGZA family xanthine/uracil permease-like MFS transporter
LGWERGYNEEGNEVEALRTHLNKHQTTARKEIMAGVISFFTVAYIIIVNSSILADAGIPPEGAIIATALSSFVGCLLIGFWSNTPILLAPGLGINALFTYTLVKSMGLTWQAALAAVVVAGVLFGLIAFTKLAELVTQAIPDTLNNAITVGIGLLLTFIGLQKGGVVHTSKTTVIELADFRSPALLVTVLTLVITIFLFVKNVPGNLLISIIAGTILSYAFGVTNADHLAWKGLSLNSFAPVFLAPSWTGILSLPFWLAAFSLSLVLVFENIGLIHGHLRMLGQTGINRFKRAFQANAISVITCGFLGTSPTVATVESAAGIAAGGKTGLTSMTTGCLFLLSLFFIPVIKWIPDPAIAPILILIGGLMLENIRNIPLNDLTEGFPAYIIIAFIPLTFSIENGIAFGFIAYPVMKLFTGRAKEVTLPLYIIAGLFLLNFVTQAFQ